MWVLFGYVLIVDVLVVVNICYDLKESLCLIFIILCWYWLMLVLC